MQVLETERLILRNWKTDDVNDLFEYAKNPNIALMAGWKTHENIEESLHTLQAFREADDIWAIECKEDHKVIGQLRLSADNDRGKFSINNAAKYISYALSETYWGKGYMTEAVNRVVQYAFEELKSEVLTAFYYPENIRSKRIIEKCGFHYETTIQSENNSLTHCVWSIWKSDFFNQ